MYKDLSKVFMNRLNQVIDSVIVESQSMFGKDIQILNKILIANAMVDKAKTRRKKS